MKRILILTNNDVWLYNLRIELINRLISEQYEVYVSTPKGDRIDNLIEEGCKIYYTDIDRRGKNVFKELKLMRQYRSILKEIKPDMILGYTVKPNIYGSLVAKRYNIPFIANVTGLGTAVMNPGLMEKVLLHMYKYAFKNNENIFLQNEANLNYFLSNKIVNQDQVTLIPGSGVNIEKFKPMNKLKNDKVLKFIFIGRLMTDKGINEYLEASEAITNKYSNVEFYLLGSFEESKYENIIKSNKNNRIKHLGFSSDVRTEIREVDCIVNPSYHEGMSNVLLEGAAMGKPLLASNIPGCKEIIDEGKNGFLFEPKSADDLVEKIIKFINLTDVERENMGRASREKVVREFDREIIVNEYMKVIESIR